MLQPGRLRVSGRALFIGIGSAAMRFGAGSAMAGKEKGGPHGPPFLYLP